MDNPPAARVEAVRDSYFGVVIEDPYRWMEDYKGEEAQTWLRSQAQHAAQVLGALPERDALLTRITALSDAGPEMSRLSVAGGRVFALRQNPGESLPRLVMYAAPDAADASETTLLDPNAISGAAHTAIDWYAPSRDGTLVAYGISQGGSEDSTLYVLDVAQGKTLDLAIPHTLFGGVCWLEDNASFLYSRSPTPTVETSVGDYYLDSRIYLHRLGADLASDPVVMGRGAHAAVDLARIDIPFVAVQPDSPWMIGLVLHGDLKEHSVYVAPKGALADPTNIPWQRVAGPDDAVTEFAFTENTLYLLTHRNAPRYQVVALPLDAPDLARATVVVPQSDAVLQDVRVAGAYLLVREMRAGVGGLRRVPRAGGALEPVPLPETGAILDWAGEPGSSVVYLATTAWTAAPRILRYDTATNTASDTGWLPPSQVDFSQIEAHEVEAPAPDGERIPLSILHRKGLAPDGAHPTLLMGYGSYGISIPPFFMPQMLAWYERGGVLAVAHIRGGGEKGDEWHQAGRMLQKENTIQDFIACAEHLVNAGYTRPALLAGEGGSAGGIPSGGALVRRPDLFAAMVMRVAMTNALRAELTDNGPPNVMEFGSATTEDGFKGLLIIDSYQRVRDGTPYPAVLLTSGANDPRIVTWMAMKMAARLQAATSSGKPVLLRLEEQGGHGMGSTRQQEDAELADKLAFLLWQFGLSGSQ